MPRRSPVLTDLEMDIMRIVWEKGEATVRDVYERMRENRSLAYTTVMTVMSTLARKGVVERKMVGRAYLYRPKVSQEEAIRRTLRYLAGKLLDGSARSLAAHLIESEDLSKEDLKELRRMIEERLKEEGG